MEKLLQLLEEQGFQTNEDLARECGLSVEEVEAKIAAWVSDGTILGQTCLINREKVANGRIRALIELKIKPEAGGGYDRLANRISRFDQVLSCSLFSGEYDLLIEVEVANSLEVATFVFDTLSKLEGVISTKTHFPLKTYKQNGIRFGKDEETERLPVTP